MVKKAGVDKVSFKKRYFSNLNLTQTWTIKVLIILKSANLTTLKPSVT